LRARRAPPNLPRVTFTLDDTWRRAQRYQPYFCEENVWQLLQVDDLPQPRAALFISNAARAVAMWGQRAAPEGPVIWDYHVVLLLPTQRVVVDLDDCDALVWPVGDWLAHAFRPQTRRDEQPRFRVVDGAEFLATFSSDRSHMCDARGRPHAPFPAWPAPYAPERGMNLMRFVDVDDPIAGTVVDAMGLLRLLA
jgi:hypothetical protein